MTHERDSEFKEATEQLRRYYRKMIQNLADEILENRSSFSEPPAFGGKAEEILERYSDRLCKLSTVYSNLVQFGEKIYKDRVRELKEDEFLCLLCRSVIHKDDRKCPKCGWSWTV